MLKKRSFIINYILNNQPESLNVQTDADTLSDEDAKKYIYETRDFDQPANITDIRIFQHAIDTAEDAPDPDITGAENTDPVTSEVRHDQD